ncbi:MAG: TIGR02444 family protein [Rhodobacteraceae bacterium]|nr:TIGR02444 family protein [Paracoccaceae bacterium]
MTDDAGAFWAFSLRVYATSGVESACLDLQDTHGLDVNLVLFCCWAGSLGVAFTKRQMADVAGQSREWQDKVVQPLRTIRRDMKNMVTNDDQKQSLRDLVKQAELSAEMLQQHSLAQSLNGKQPDTPGKQVIRVNLQAYAGVAGCDCNIVRLCEPIIAASLPAG